MEIADAFIINKADRDGADADLSANNLKNKPSKRSDQHNGIQNNSFARQQALIKSSDFIRSSHNIKNTRLWSFLLADKGL